MIKRVLISVYNKTGIIYFAKDLAELGVEIIATDGTFAALQRGGIEAIERVSHVTKTPEILDGRVKTEHTKIMGGILAQRENIEHVNELRRLEINPFDMVVQLLSV